MQHIIKTRKIIVEVDEHTFDYINDYKFAIYTQCGETLSYSNVMLIAVESLKKTAAAAGLKVEPRPVRVREREAQWSASVKAGMAKKKNTEEQQDGENQ